MFCFHHGQNLVQSTACIEKKVVIDMQLIVHKIGDSKRFKTGI